MRDWLATLEETLRNGGQPIVRVVVAATRGSAPREAGASMLVSAEGDWGTIGGGHLELIATRTARDMLAGTRASPRHDRFALGASLGQCCGGIVELWLQRYDEADLAPLGQALRLRGEGAPDASIAALVSRDPAAARYERFSPEVTPLWLFGAGHVGRALVNVLAPLPFAFTWIDSREGQIPAAPGNVTALFSPQPADEVADMPPHAFALVMTHSHDEDLAIAAALLGDARFAWAGVIGSMPKTKRFRQRLSQRGFSAERIARLTMPVGIGGIRSKEPAAIAVAVAAQLLQVREACAQASAAPGIARES